MIADATIIAQTRALWPVLTTAVASDALLEAWAPVARSYVGTGWGAAELFALAHLLAHYAYRVDPTGTLSGGSGGGVGAVTSQSTLGLSVSYAAPASSLPPADADLAATRPGIEYLRLRSSRAFTLARSF